MEGLLVSSSPHIRTKATTQKIMLEVCASLIPAVIGSIVIFGGRAFFIIVISVVSCVVFEYIARKLMKRPDSISDLSSVVTGLLLAMSYPVSLPLWIPLIGSFIAIVIVKQMFGGLGNNIVNPAITARVALFISFPAQMTNWELNARPVFSVDDIDAISTATPLTAVGEQRPSLLGMFLGTHGGSLGETCIVALLIGGIYLMIRGIITFHIPVSFLATCFVGFAMLGLDPLYNIMAGGIVLGAFFMATDYVTSPISNKGRLIFGFGCAALTILFRVASSMPGGVSFAILLMNLLVPLIDRITKTRPFGGVVK